MPRVRGVGSDAAVMRRVMVVTIPGSAVKTKYSRFADRCSDDGNTNRSLRPQFTLCEPFFTIRLRVRGNNVLVALLRSPV